MYRLGMVILSARRHGFNKFSKVMWLHNVKAEDLQGVCVWVDLCGWMCVCARVCVGGYVCARVWVDVCARVRVTNNNVDPPAIAA